MLEVIDYDKDRDGDMRFVAEIAERGLRVKGWYKKYEPLCSVEMQINGRRVEYSEDRFPLLDNELRKELAKCC